MCHKLISETGNAHFQVRILLVQGWAIGGIVALS